MEPTTLFGEKGSFFPLYDILLKESSEGRLSIDQKRDMIKKITTLSSQEHQTIFTIIRIYSFRNNEFTHFDLPYSGKKIGKRDLQFNLDNFPPILQNMILKFLNSLK